MISADNYLNFYNFSIWLGNQPSLQLFVNMAELYSAYSTHFRENQNAVVPLIVLDESAFNRLTNNNFPEGFITVLTKEEAEVEAANAKNQELITNILQQKEESSIIEKHVSHVVRIKACGEFQTSYIPIICFNFGKNLTHDYHTTVRKVFPVDQYEKIDTLMPFCTIDSLLQQKKFVAASDYMRLLMLVILKNAIYCDITKIQPAVTLTPKMIEESENKLILTRHKKVAEICGTGITSGETEENQSIFSNNVEKALNVLLHTFHRICWPQKLQSSTSSNSEDEKIFERAELKQEKLTEITSMLDEFRKLLAAAIANQMSSIDTFKSFIITRGRSAEDYMKNEIPGANEILSKWDGFHDCIDAPFSRYSDAMRRNKNYKLHLSLNDLGFSSWATDGLKGSTSCPALSFWRDFIYSGEKLYQQQSKQLTDQDFIYLSAKNMLNHMIKSLNNPALDSIVDDDISFLAIYAYKFSNNEITDQDESRLAAIYNNIVADKLNQVQHSANNTTSVSLPKLKL
jgi:hypothetical protein